MGYCKNLLLQAEELDCLDGNIDGININDLTEEIADAT